MHVSLSRLATLVLVAVFAALLPAAVGAPAAHAQTPAVVINEFVADNDNGLVDNTGEFEDWIELHNTSGASVNLLGWTLSDSDETYTFGDFTLAAGEYRVIFASNAQERTNGPVLHLPFKLSADGEPLRLRDSTNVISQPDFPAPGFPAMTPDVSYGRTSDGGLAFFANPTPGEANSGAAGGIVGSVSFSVPHGFYDAAQNVVLDTPTPGSTIRYTFDGSTPTDTTGIVLAPGQSIPVSTTSMVRAIAYRPGWITSNVETRSYFFTADIMTQSEATPPGWPADGAVNGSAFDYGMDPNIVNGNQSTIAASLTSIPTLSIVTDQSNLTDSSTGIYVNAQRTGREWERPASVELIDPTGAEAGFDINAGLRIRGGGSRRADNPKHSLRLYFRNDYGDGALEYPLFGDDGVDRFESLGLATGQNGSWSYRGEADATWVRDPWIRETQAAMGQPNTDSRYYHLYLNGQYWGLYYSQERLSGSHGAEHFGGDEDDYDVVGGNWRAAATASDGNVDGFRELYSLVSDGVVTNGEFDLLDAAVDLENLAAYYLLHFFSGDFDASPMGWDTGGFRWADSNNWRAFQNRYDVGPAGKWIFFDHDSEFTLCGLASELDTDNTTPWNLEQGSVPNHQVPTPAWLHEALITHPTYQQIFQDSVAEHMLTAGGALTDAANQARFDAVIAQVSGAIDAEAARWGDALGEPANDRSDWNANIARMRQCATDRLPVVQAQLEADGLWPTASAPSIAPAEGEVPFGTQLTISANDEPGTIYFTTNGTDPRNPDGSVAAAATEYTAPLVVNSALTVRARVLDGLVWTPVANASYTLAAPTGPVPLLVNEYNAVGKDKFLGGGGIGDAANGSDATFGRVQGNGGDWFELVVLQDLDITGWTFQLWHFNDGAQAISAELVVASVPEMASLAAGTIITVSEDIADDLSFDPTQGDWHINLQADGGAPGGYFTAASQEAFAMDNSETQIAIFDAAGAPVAGLTGEGTVADVAVGSTEVFKLEGDPESNVTPDSSLYADGTSSTWGLANVSDDGTATQDLSSLRVVMGDADCDTQVTIVDALAIAQFTVTTRTGVTSCPVDPATEILLPAADVNNNGVVDISDALLVAQCTVGLTNIYCPE